MNIKSEISKNILIMTAVNLIMRSVSVSFNAYMSTEIGTAGIGLFQLIMSVYSMAVTFSCAGIKLATTRIAVEINTLKKNDLNKSLAFCVTYAGISGAIIGFILFALSGLIGKELIGNTDTVFPLKILSVSLPFTAMTSSLGGYFTAIGKIPQYSFIQTFEQLFKISVIVISFHKISDLNIFASCCVIVTGMTLSEIFSFSLSSIYYKKSIKSKTTGSRINPVKFFRIAVPDAAGTCIRSVLLTTEHLLIPQKLNSGSTQSLAVYGNIHGLVMPLLLYPAAILSSVSSMIIPELASKYESGKTDEINIFVKKNLKRTIIYSIFCSLIFFVFAHPLSEAFCKNKEAAMYIKILSPLVPVMYTDMVTDGMLKGLDQQISSMRFNIIDSAICVILVILLLPKYSVKGYIVILYASELINFYLSLNKLISICEIRFFQEHKVNMSTFFQQKKYSTVR